MSDMNTNAPKNDENKNVVLANSKEMVQTIDLLELGKAFLRRWVLIVICMAVCGGVLGTYCFLFMPSKYKADVSMYIANTEKSDNLSVSDLQLSALLTSDYRKIITSRRVLTEVIDNLKLDMSYEALKSTVEVTNPDNSHIIEIGIVHRDADQAMEIANEVLKVSVDEIYQLIGTTEPVVLDVSESNFVKNVKTSVLKMILLGALLGMVGCCGVITMKVLLDHSIKSEEDVAKYLELPVLAMVPHNDNKASGYGYGYGRTR